MGKSATLLGLFGVLCTLHSLAWADQRLQRLNQFQQRYNNSRSDIIFLMDLSGSVSRYGFDSEKKFISSLLSEISVQPEASRVAVITFGSNVERNIDYIGIATTDKNKCTFVKDLGKIGYSNRGLTNMNGAFIDGKQLLEAAKRKGVLRDNINRAFVLLTDGYWNTGGNPATTAAELRDRSKFDSEIYSVGVSGASIYQLQQISADNSKVIMANTFTDFANLAARIRGDQIEKLYQHVDNSICGFQCDPRAFCSCGTISGIYQCACGPGYEGSGRPGRCRACPVGTYKLYTSPDPCKKCPDFSSTKATGSKSKADCTCFTGYNGNPGKNVACTVVKCPDISQALTNGQVKDCGNEYKQTCTFTCNQYHHVAGEENTERKVSCQSNGQWSAGRPNCVPVLCQLPSKPLNMIVTCPSSATVGTKCTYKCETGYIRNGPAERECQPDGQWSGVLPSCQIVTCPALRKILNVEIQPPSCLSKDTNYNDGCSQACKKGFTAETTSIRRVCGADGTWSGTELACKDTTPPSITCPDDITASTDIGKDNKELSFPDPIAKDNTVDEAGSVTVTHAPSTIKSPHKFPIGITQIDYTATDSAGNTAKCSFRVSIRDDEDPKFTYCPQNIEITIEKPGETTAVVDWKAPTYTDNSGQVTLTYQSHTPPHTFSYGTVFAVSYIVKDGSGNQATCEFFIKVDKKKCPPRDAPINGALACTTAGTSGDFCFPSCQKPYDFNGPKAYYYICTPAQTWQPVPPYPIFMQRWPDCTNIAPASGTEQSMKFYYYSGSCHESKSARDEIKSNFLSVLGLYLQSIGQGGCENPANARTCSTDSVVLKCGKIEAIAGLRFRRSTQNNFEIDVQIQVKSSEDKTTQTQALNTVTSKLEQLPSSGKEGENLRNLRVQGDILSLQKVQRVGNPTAFCSGGSIFDTGSQAQTGGKCVSCLGGKYYNKDTKQCTSCPKGTYTEEPGRIGCSNCPKGTITASEGTYNRTECRAPCEPGSISSTGLQGCQACPKGEYQTGYFGTKCSQCPGATSTLTVGSKTMWQCGMPCTRGTYSDTGVEPCHPCPVGYYSSKSNAVRCTPCPGELSTHGEGAADSSMCVKIDYCASNPCINGGSCKNERDNFKCTCATGYYGNRCELEINDCAKTPCSKDATCVDLVNDFECMCSPFYFGRYCAERKQTCHSTLCQNNGVCTDSPDGFHCSCPAGFTGVYCERTTYECASSPCKNGGHCIDKQGGFTCQCAPGWTGESCETNIDDCAQNNLCLNGGECVDGINEFTCKCAPGYVGDRCQLDKDDCASNPCRNGGSCIDEVNDYECICQATFHGKSCEKRVTLSNFDLDFNKDTTAFANKTLHHPIKQFTVAFWMRAAATDTESGTPVSYAVPVGDKFVDNALVLRDFNSFLLVIMDKSADLKMSANDDLWHHIAVSWSSTTGLVSAYRDGLKIGNVANFQKDVVIPGGGHLVVGQEQDEVGRNFSAGEAFDGSLSQLNMWNQVLSDAEILEMSRYRCDNKLGDLVAWPDFTLTMTDIDKSVHFCTVAKTRYSDWKNGSPKTSGVEREGSSCAGQSSYGQCASLDDKLAKDLNLFSASCTKDGFYCSDAEEKKPNDSNPPCPDFKARFECPYTPPNHCSTNPCKNGGTCENGLGGHRCICRDGYMGNSCEKTVGCSHNDVFADGTVTSDSSRASFSCNAGYVLQGASTLTCVAGRWNAPLPECVDADECKTNNGGCKQVCINTVGSFRCACNKGYQLSGKTDCQDVDECATSNGNCQDKCHNFVGGYRCSCRAGYKVSADLHSCEDIDNCKTGEHDCKQLCINTRGSFECACSPGYNLAADKKSCDRISCPNLGVPNNGKVDAGDKLFQTMATYTCNTGYKLNGPSTRTCLANGKWSGADPGCQPIACVLLGSIYNGKVIGSGTGYGKKYTFACVQGFRLEGESELICQQDSTWSGSTPMCLPAGCNKLSPPANGAVIGNALYAGASVLIRCDKGYQLTDPNANFRTCQASGSWAGTPAVCQVVDCGAPSPLGNGTITGGNHKYGQKVIYQCNSGFGLSGPAERTCQEDGKWSGVDPTCLYRSCGFPGSPDNGKFTGDDYSFDQVVKYECNLGYNLKGVKERLCLHSGKWSDSVPTCEIVNCGDPGTPTNGERLGDEFTWQSKLVFDCKPGFSLKGSRIRECKETGQWTGTQPTCVSGVCGAANLIGPTGSFNTPGYPNSYKNDLYCRWDVTVSSVKKAAVRIDRLETEAPGDTVEIRDAGSNQLITILSGLVKAPVLFTSASNKIDVRFLSDANNAADLDGLKATYLATSCGGNILSLSAEIKSPNYPSNYPNDVECTWQILINRPFILRFKYFKTYDSRDTLEIYNKLSDISPKTLTDTFHGSRGFLTATSNTGQMFVRFKSDSVYNAPGFQAVVEAV